MEIKQNAVIYASIRLNLKINILIQKDKYTKFKGKLRKSF